MEHKVSCDWLDNMAFRGEIDGHQLTVDASVELGGQDRGPRPKPLLLLSLAGCTGIDVVSILTKMRVNLQRFRIEVIGNQTEDHPKTYDKIKVMYFFKGVDLDRKKLEKAVQLSEEKYCGVTAMLKNAGLIEYEIIIE